MEVLLCSTEYIKSRSPLFENVDEKTLREAIYDSQIMYIEPLLGSELFNEIIDQVANDAITPDNKTLLDGYIVNTLKFYACYEAGGFVKTAYTPTGIKTLTQDSSQELLYTEFKAYMSKWEARAQFWAKKAILFLKEENNSGKYPLYSAGNNDRLDQVGPVNSQYTSSLYLGDRGSSGCSSEYYDHEAK